MVNTSPTPEMTPPELSLSIPDPSMIGWLAGWERRSNSLSAGTSIVRHTETGWQVSSVMGRFLPGPWPPGHPVRCRAAGMTYGHTGIHRPDCPARPPAQALAQLPLNTG